MPKNILLTTASPPIASAKLKISDAHLSVDSLMEINFLRHENGQLINVKTTK